MLNTLHPPTYTQMQLVVLIVVDMLLLLFSLNSSVSIYRMCMFQATLSALVSCSSNLHRRVLPNISHGLLQFGSSGHVVRLSVFVCRNTSFTPREDFA